MGKFNKTGKRGMPELNTSSLPDLIFTMLFFFMIVTTMREVTLKVQFQVPQGTELEKLEKKSLVSFIYIGKPLPEFQKKNWQSGSLSEWEFPERSSSKSVPQQSKMSIVIQ